MLARLQEIDNLSDEYVSDSDAEDYNHEAMREFGKQLEYKDMIEDNEEGKIPTYKFFSNPISNRSQ
jgi:hypothetical protein